MTMIGFALDSIREERARQERLKIEGRYRFTCADSDPTPCEKLAILGEEFGEAAHEVNETIDGHAQLDHVKLRKELVQIAAVSVAWIEALDREDGGR